MIEVTLGHFQIVEKIGAGGMGEVYRARDMRLGRDVALKVLPSEFADDPERMARFGREAQVLASLNHPNIAAIYGLEESNGKRALAMELVPGETLEQIIANRDLGMAGAMSAAKQIADALEYAHERGVIHRDLKPANIKLTPDGTVKILDFGLAKALENSPQAADIRTSPTISVLSTKAGVILGTAAYMSPEQARGKDVDRRTDIWSFGALLYEMLTGRQAFPGETISDTLAAVIKEEPDWALLPSNLPGPVANLIRRCLVKDSRRRLRDIGEARIAIEGTISGSAFADAAPGSRAPAASQPSWRRALPWILASAAAVAGATALAIGFHPVERSVSPVTRLEAVLSPEQQLVFPDSPVLAISPDGRSLAYLAQEDGITRVYIRALGDTQGRFIAGTEDAKNPFFSPDGQWVGFFGDLKLKKIAVAGGTPVTLCDAPTPRGASWGPDDTIVFSPDYASGLFRVSAAGGKPEVVTTPDSARGERTHRWPEVLPNGKGVLFTIGSTTSPGNYDVADLGVLSFQTGKTRVLVTGVNTASYARSGHILFTRAGLLYAVPFDVDRLELRGQPVPVVSNVGGDPSSGAGYWSVSANGTLAYISRRVRPANQNLVLMNRKGEGTVLALPPRPYVLPRFSPDGRRLAFSIGSGWGGENDIWTYDLSSKSLNRLTFGNHSGYPLWSPDGKRIAFEASGNEVSIDVKAADGSGPEEVLVPRSNYPQLPDSWSPDGKTLAYVLSAPTENTWTFSLNGNERPRLFQARAYGAVFSPDGRWIAYTSPENGSEEVYVRSFPDPTGKWQVSQDGGTSPRWTKKGNGLVYLQGEKVMEVDVDPGNSFEASAPRLLFQLPSGNYDVKTAPAVNYDVTADGETFVFVGRVAEPAAAPRLEFVLNWFEELQKEAASRK